MMPRPLLMLLMLLAGVPIVIGIWHDDVGRIGILMTMVIVVAALVDLILSPSLSKLEVERETSEVVSIGARNPVRIWVTNKNTQYIIVRLHDEPPQPCAIEDLPSLLTVPAGATQYHVYHLEPHQRGKSEFGNLFLQSVTRMGFWTLHQEREHAQPAHVYPDIQAVYKIELLARRNRLAQAGIRLSRLRGRGNEFDRLREYQREDEYRSIDWKATARHQTLISREYVVERDQNILFLLDCGRSMCNEHDGISHFDRALNAAIVLGYVALRQGDSVGLLACSNKVEGWVSPMRGTTAIQSMIRQIYDLQPQYEATDYNMMIEQLRSRYRKRSLVILLTHALDEVHLNSLSEHLRQLRSPHLVLGAFLQNVDLMDRMHAIPKTAIEAFQVAAAAEMVAHQEAQIAKLQQSGLLVVQSEPEDLSTNLINQYLEIKARHLL